MDAGALLIENMGDAMSTCAGGEGASNNNNKFNKPTFHVNKKSLSATASSRNSSNNVNESNDTKADNPFQQYERERVSKQALIAQKIDAQDEYELEIAKVKQKDRAATLGDMSSTILHKARKKYIIKLLKIKELASINFQYTLVKQIELEIQAIKKVGGKTIAGDEEYLNIPLEVPKVSFELKEIKTPVKEVSNNDNDNNEINVHNNDNDNNNSQSHTNDNNEQIKNNKTDSNKSGDPFTEREIIKKTIKKFPPENPLPMPTKALTQQGQQQNQNQYLTFEEKRNQIWKEDINLRMKKKNAVKSNLHNLLERQREKNIGT